MSGPCTCCCIKSTVKRNQMNKQINTPLIHVLRKMQIYTPEELRAKLRCPSGPSNMSDSASVSISRRRNSWRGPPRSTASSVVPLSSENFTDILFGSKESRLNPLIAPSRTAERLMLNLHTCRLSILSLSSLNI